MNLITLQNATLAWGDKPLLDEADLMVEEGRRYGLIGRNGTGKSSLMKVLAGLEKLDEGKQSQLNNLKVVYVEQEPVFPQAATALDSLLKRAKIDEHEDEKAKWQLKSKISEYLHKFGLDEEKLDLSKASGGESKKAALALALALQPDLLLLDEPTNHLDIDAILTLENLILTEFRNARSLIAVTHDRAFLNKISEQIIELDRGRLSLFPGSFEAYEARKNDELRVEEIQNRHFDKFWKQEEAWIRKGIEARRTRNEGRVRRLERLRVMRAERRDRLGSAKISLSEGERSGKLVAELENVSLSFGSRKIINDLTLRVMRGDKLGILGPNGVGKTTLVKIILGQLQPDEGTVRLGTNLNIAYFDQLRKELDGEKDLLETVSPGSEWVEINGTKKHVIGYLTDFLFPPHRMNVKVSSLSGGERNRLLLAKLFAKPANLLVMDEPTNDLDIETLELLEDTLASYPGTVILVSHDRKFMDDVADFVIGPDEAGNWTVYANGFEGWLAERRNREQLLKEKSAKQKESEIKEAPKAPPQKVKLTFRENRELEELPDKIASLEEEKDKLIAMLQSPDYFSLPPEKKIEDGLRMKAVEDELTAKYARWEELEGKKEAMQNK